ncbi:MAG: cytochrome c-type biogenesis protein CcmH [Acidobacteriota bacterium]|jgi:cytochrome c-type biogenesis protein CcmH/NrfF
MSSFETYRTRRATRSRFGDPAGKAALFAMAAIAALLLAVPFSMWLAMAPADQSQAERLGHEIGCVCGTCPLRPIATCGCGFADSMLVKLDEEVAAGHTDDEIMAVFVAEYGSQIKIKPEGSGVGLMAWLAPMALLMVGAVGMAAVISHWRGQQPAPEAAAVAEGPTPQSQDSSAPPTSKEQDRYRDIVERELDDLDV